MWSARGRPKTRQRRRRILESHLGGWCTGRSELSSPGRKILQGSCSKEVRALLGQRPSTEHLCEALGLHWIGVDLERGRPAIRRGVSRWRSLMQTTTGTSLGGRGGSIREGPDLFGHTCISQAASFSGVGALLFGGFGHSSRPQAQAGADPWRLAVLLPQGEFESRAGHGACAPPGVGVAPARVH
jgi:hypothetical protein